MQDEKEALDALRENKVRGLVRKYLDGEMTRSEVRGELAGDNKAQRLFEQLEQEIGAAEASKERPAAVEQSA